MIDCRYPFRYISWNFGERLFDVVVKYCLVDYSRFAVDAQECISTVCYRLEAARWWNRESSKVIQKRKQAFEGRNCDTAGDAEQLQAAIEEEHRYKELFDTQLAKMVNHLRNVLLTECETMPFGYFPVEQLDAIQRGIGRQRMNCECLSAAGKIAPIDTLMALLEWEHEWRSVAPITDSLAKSQSEGMVKRYVAADLAHTQLAAAGQSHRSSLRPRHVLGGGTLSAGVLNSLMEEEPASFKVMVHAAHVEADPFEAAASAELQRSREICRKLRTRLTALTAAPTGKMRMRASTRNLTSGLGTKMSDRDASATMAAAQAISSPTVRSDGWLTTTFSARDGGATVDAALAAVPTAPWEPELETERAAEAAETASDEDVLRQCGVPANLVTSLAAELGEHRRRMANLGQLKETELRKWFLLEMRLQYAVSVRPVTDTALDQQGAYLLIVPAAEADEWRTKSKKPKNGKARLHLLGTGPNFVDGEGWGTAADSKQQAADAAHREAVARIHALGAAGRAEELALRLLPNSGRPDEQSARLLKAVDAEKAAADQERSKAAQADRLMRDGKHSQFMRGVDLDRNSVQVILGSTAAPTRNLSPTDKLVTKPQCCFSLLVTSPLVGGGRVVHCSCYNATQLRHILTKLWLHGGPVPTARLNGVVDSQGMDEGKVRGHIAAKQILLATSGGGRSAKLARMAERMVLSVSITTQELRCLGKAQRFRGMRDWDGLQPANQQRARLLGWDRRSWRLRALRVEGWAVMATDQREAATFLGYNQETWDADRSIWAGRAAERLSGGRKTPKDMLHAELKASHPDLLDDLTNLLKPRGESFASETTVCSDCDCVVEPSRVSKIFDEHAERAEDGKLDRRGLGHLCSELGMSMSAAELTEATISLQQPGGAVAVEREAFQQWWETQHTADEERKRRIAYWDSGRAVKTFRLGWEPAAGRTESNCLKGFLDNDQQASAQHLGWTRESWEADRLLLGWRTPSVDPEEAADQVAALAKKVQADLKKQVELQANVAEGQSAARPYRFAELTVLLSCRFLLSAEREQTPANNLGIHATIARFGPQDFDLRLINVVAAEPPGLVVFPGGVVPRSGDTAKGTVKAMNLSEIRGSVVLVTRGGGRGFLEKTLYLQESQAAAVIFVDQNDQPDGEHFHPDASPCLETVGGQLLLRDNVNIPVVAVPWSTGALLKRMCIPGGERMLCGMQSKPATQASARPAVTQEKIRRQLYSWFSRCHTYPQHCTLARHKAWAMDRLCCVGHHALLSLLAKYDIFGAGAADCGEAVIDEVAFRRLLGALFPEQWCDCGAVLDGSCSCNCERVLEQLVTHSEKRLGGGQRLITQKVFLDWCAGDISDPERPGHSWYHILMFVASCRSSRFTVGDVPCRH